MFHEYPYTNFHELNLDWIIRQIKKLTGVVDDFVAYNKITFRGTWTGTAYPAWSVVDDGAGNGYLSLKAVPAGVALSDSEYWSEIASYATIYAAFNDRITALENKDPIFTTPEEYGAVADGVTDDRAAIQDAIDSGLPVVFKAGKTYAFKVDNGKGFTIPSGASLNLNGATLQQIYNGDTGYSLLYMENIRNVEIFGGTIVGDKDDNTVSTEWCYGIFGRNANSVYLHDLVVTKCSGDGIEFGDVLCVNIHVDNVVCDDNGRNGLSITNARGVFITNSVFSNTSGHNPQEGIDLEANTSSDVLQHIYISNCSMIGNVHAGLNILSLADGDSIIVTDCILDCSVMSVASGADSSIIVKGCSITPYAQNGFGTDWSYGVGFGVSVGCSANSSILYDDIVINTANDPGYGIIYAEGVVIPGRYNITLTNIKLVGGGNVQRYVLNRGGGVYASRMVLDIGDVTVIENTQDYLSLSPGGSDYNVQLIGRREVTQPVSLSGSLASDIVLTSTDGSNTNLYWMQPNGETRIYNKGTASAFLISNDFINAAGTVTNRLEIPSGSSVELKKSPDSTKLAYRFI